MKVPYIDYKGMREFYTIREVCQLFHCEKDELKQACKKYGVEPRRNEIGEYGFVTYDVRKLHNALFHEQKAQQEEDGPWA